MTTKQKQQTERPLFELKEELDDRIIYQRVIKNKGKNKAEIKRRVNQLPTATVHFFSEDDFTRLKKIEGDLMPHIKLVEKTSTSIRKMFFKFMEV